MKLGIFSDIHDHVDNLQLALDEFKSHDVSTLIFCGDLCSAIPLRLMGRFSGKIHAVLGNNDGDKLGILGRINEEVQNVILYDEKDHAELNIADRKLGFTHYPSVGKKLVDSKKYDAVFYGHTHQKNTEQVGDCLFLNPGDIMGLNEEPSIAIYDTEKNEAQYIQFGRKIKYDHSQ